MWRKNKNSKSTQEEQDEAFFGTSTGTTNSSTTTNDEKLAMELQEQYLKDDSKYSNNGSSNSTTDLADLTDLVDLVALESRNRERARQEREDMEMAMRLQRMGSSTSSGLGLVSSQHEERKRQEEEDAKLARAIQQQEEEEEQSSAGRMGTVHQNQNSSGNSTRSGNSSGNSNGNTNSNRLSGRSIPDHHTINALRPRCATCNQIVLGSPIAALGNIYHAGCFKCVACHGTIGTNESFAIMTDDDGQRFPMHKPCYSNLYGLKCTVCRNVIEGDANGRISYVKHPFFEEVMCPSHAQTDTNTNTYMNTHTNQNQYQHQRQRKCAGCHRFEPTGAEYKFADLGDADRCVCYSCCRTVIVDSNDAKPLWEKVIRFFRDGLGLPIFDSMKTIPVLIVPHEALNSQLQHQSNQNHHQGSTQIMTRGLCLSEHQIGLNFMLPSLRFDRSAGSFLPRDAESRGHTYFEIPKASKANPQTNVTAILCLSGLPSDLSASILAHEATHAWIKLHPSFNPSMPIPPQVEEGVCQLVAMLFLNDGLEEASKVNEDSDGGPSDEKLRQYFKFSIETDTNEVYGEGYRKAAKAYAQIGIEALLSHIVNYREFPNI